MQNEYVRTRTRIVISLPEDAFLSRLARRVTPLLRRVFGPRLAH